MKIEKGYPPNFEDIIQVFPDAKKSGAVFTYGPTLYNPSKKEIPYWLMVHETAHSLRQGEDPASWWQQYLTNPKFMFDEELIAHQAEYKALCTVIPDRNKRFNGLRQMALRLSGPLYKRPVSYFTAKRLISQEN